MRKLIIDGVSIPLIDCTINSQPSIMINCGSGLPIRTTSEHSVSIRLPYNNFILSLINKTLSENRSQYIKDVKKDIYICPDNILLGNTLITEYQINDVNEMLIELRPDYIQHDSKPPLKELRRQKLYKILDKLESEKINHYECQIPGTL